MRIKKKKISLSSQKLFRTLSYSSEFLSLFKQILIRSEVGLIAYTVALKLIQEKTKTEKDQWNIFARNIGLKRNRIKR